MFFNDCGHVAKPQIVTHLRVFQNSGLSRSYANRFNRLAGTGKSFDVRLGLFFQDAYGASHILKPICDGESEGFFTNGDDATLQRAWARENGLAKTASLAEILLTQIEHHRTEVFYNLDPMLYDATFVRQLPGCVRVKLAWRAAPGTINFAGYDRVVSNFPSIRAQYERQGIATAELFPGHDKALEPYATQRERRVDVVFCGGFTRHHLKRRAILESVAALGHRYRVVYHLDSSRLTKLADSPLGWVGPLAKMRQPKSIRSAAAKPVFGTQMYQALGNAKIVLNAAIDMAGDDRGNMRCFEAMGAGATLLTDGGNYPSGMEAESTMLVYNDPQDAAVKIIECLEGRMWDAIAQKGHQMVKTLYSKEHQYEQFLGILDDI